MKGMVQFREAISLAAEYAGGATPNTAAKTNKKQLLLLLLGRGIPRQKWL
jgi:hypothetical protein